MYVIPLPKQLNESMWYGILVTDSNEKLIVFNPEKSYYDLCWDRYVYVVDCDTILFKTTPKSLEPFCKSINNEYGEAFCESELRL